MTEHIFRTVDGAELKLHPVSQVLLQRLRQAVRKQYEERGEPLAAPTYTATTVTGETETHPHDPTTLETDADKAAWAAYLDANQRLQAEMNERVTRVMITRGVDLPDVPGGWLNEMHELGIELPSDPVELRAEYLVMEYLKTPADTQNLIAEIMALSYRGANPEVTAAIEALFRRHVEGPAAA